MNADEILKALDICLNSGICPECPRENDWKPLLICRGLAIDIQELLKKQQEETAKYKMLILSMPSWLDEKRPEVVRCKDCVHFEPDGIYTMCYRHNGLSQNADWFCADGERKEGR